MPASRKNIIKMQIYIILINQKLVPYIAFRRSVIIFGHEPIFKTIKRNVAHAYSRISGAIPDRY